MLPELLTLLFLAAIIYGFYSCAWIVWMCIRALTTFDD